MKEPFFQCKTALPDQAFTHGAKFHSDDVFATAFLRLIKPEIQVTRGFEVPADFDGIVYDIGRGRFDHHQEDKEYRENGCPYAAFGLLWREYGAQCIGEEEAVRFDESFVQPLDESDNTGCHNVLASIIDEFNPSWDSEESYDDCFWRAVKMAEEILRNHFEAVAGIVRAASLVRKAMEESNGSILIDRIITKLCSVLFSFTREIFLQMRNTLLIRNIFIMIANFRLSRWRIDRFRQFVGFFQSFRQFDATYGSVLLIACPSASGNITTNNAFDRQHF